MDFKVIWSEAAIADLNDICSYIAQHNPQAAHRLGRGILDHVRILASFPLGLPQNNIYFSDFEPEVGDRE